MQINVLLESEWWRFPIFVYDTRNKRCRARCQVLCGCNPAMQYVRLRIIFLNRRYLKIIRYVVAGTHIFYCADMHKLTQTNYGPTSNLKTNTQ